MLQLTQRKSQSWAHMWRHMKLMWAHTAICCPILSRVHLCSPKVCNLQSCKVSQRWKDRLLRSWIIRRRCLPCVWEPVLWVMSKSFSEEQSTQEPLAPWSTWLFRHKGRQIELLTRTYRIETARVEERMIFIRTCTTSWVRPCGLPCFPLSLVICPKIGANKYTAFSCVIGA